MKKVGKRRIKKILESDPDEVELLKNEKVYITAQILCDVLDFVTKENKIFKLTDLYIYVISYNSVLHTKWAKVLFNKMSFCQLVSYSGRCENKYYNIIKKSDGLYIEPKEVVDE